MRMASACFNSGWIELRAFTVSLMAVNGISARATVSPDSSNKIPANAQMPMRRTIIAKRSTVLVFPVVSFVERTEASVSIPFSTGRN